jgi:hypothetical protein
MRAAVASFEPAVAKHNRQTQTALSAILKTIISTPFYFV